MMICPKCNWGNAEDSVFCNKCGYKLFNEETNDDAEYIYEQDDNTLENSVEIVQPSEQKDINKKKIKRTVIIIVGILLAILVIAGGIVFKIKLEQSNYEKYELNFTKATAEIITETYICEVMCTSISDAWSSAIDSSYRDFNTEISELESSWKSDGSLDKRQKAKDDIEKTMKQLQNPPKDYIEAYKLLVELYGYYGQIYSQATSPHGSLMTYNQDVNQKASEFNKTFDKIIIMKPDIKSKINK